MKDKENKIEEMFQDVAKVMCDCEDKEKFFRPHRYGCKNCYMLTVIQHIVFFLRNSDYLKPPKDSVVLSREDMKKYAKDCIAGQETGLDIINALIARAERYKEQAKQASKETAEKFVKLLDEKCEGSQDYRYSYGNIKEIVYELAKQFGVEIKE